MSEAYEGTHDDTKIRLQDTKHGVALSVEFWEPDVLPDEPRAGSTVYLSQEQIDGMAKWLEQKSSSYVARLASEWPVLNAALNTWFATDQGATCLSGEARGKYLKNRLEAAFIAGWDARSRCEPSQSTKE